MVLSPSASAGSSGSAVTDPLTSSDVLVPLRFRHLGEARDHYQLLARLDMWRALEPVPLLALGSEHDQVHELRQLLRLYDDLPSGLEPDNSRRFDPALDSALRRYQHRHGLAVDGVLGPETRASLNVSPLERAQQLEINRQRQLAFLRLQQARYVQVNIPEFRLRLIDDGEEVITMKTIIGRSERPTPVLSSAIHSLVVNPSWNVPRSIAYEDILPRWDRDEAYLERNNLKVVAGWTTPRTLVPAQQVRGAGFYSGRQYLRLWQPPGANNALGRLKFDFTNRHAVYIHDTPKRELFAENQRAFSSGCVRVEQPERLARYLLRQDAGLESLQSALEDGRETRRIRLQQPVPVHLTYWTAWLDDQGQVQFRPDIYRQDRADYTAFKLGQVLQRLSEL